MTGAALALVLTASSIHAGWNLLTKRAGNRLAFLWLSLGTGLVIFLPAVTWIAFSDPPQLQGVLLAVVSGIVHAGYYSCLARMYEYDFSLTYPMARGLSPVLVTAGSLLVLREPLTGAGLAGIGLVICGILTLNLRRGPEGGLEWPLREVWKSGGGRAAALTAVAISCYSLVDRTGVRYANPVLYLWLSHAVAFGGYALWAHRRRAIVAEEWQARRPAILTVGVAQNLAYILVLFAMRLAPVAYVVPTREVSTLIGTALGVYLLREPFPVAKLGGAALIASGVALIALWG